MEEPRTYVVAYRMGTPDRFKWQIVRRIFRKDHAEEWAQGLVDQNITAVVLVGGTPVPETWEGPQ
jgi:hypothetical protein